MPGSTWHLKNLCTHCSREHQVPGSLDTQKQDRHCGRLGTSHITMLTLSNTTWFELRVSSACMQNHSFSFPQVLSRFEPRWIIGGIKWELDTWLLTPFQVGQNRVYFLALLQGAPVQQEGSNDLVHRDPLRYCFCFKDWMKILCLYLVWLKGLAWVRRWEVQRAPLSLCLRDQ